jgi:hypothetical protein
MSPIVFLDGVFVLYLSPRQVKKRFTKNILNQTILEPKRCNAAYTIRPAPITAIPRGLSATLCLLLFF